LVFPPTTNIESKEVGFMKIQFFNTCIFIISLTILISCQSTSAVPKNDKEAFEKYWKQGLVEVSTYQFAQSTDSNQFKGNITLIYEIENFSKKRGLKLEEPKKHPGDAMKVLKCNMILHSSDSMNQYNWMTSIFTPVDYNQYSHSMKWTASSQDWNGQTYLQANWKGYRYETHSYSSFANEGDLEVKLVNAWLEDEIWNKIRVSPEELPIGKIKLVPGAFYFRSSHSVLKDYDAIASITEVQGQFQYSISYPELKRKVIINFEKELPHKILWWKEMQNEKEIFVASLRP
jgi:hypothetical protein